MLESEGLSPRWHLIGSLQTNKVRQVVGRTALIHSVDRIGLAEEIGRCSVRSGMTTPVLLQFNLSHEESKHGFDESEAERALDACSRIPGICMEGLMTMAPLAGGSSAAAQAFDTARRLFERLRDSGVADPDVFCRLSMGMSGDFPEAIRAGATIIRVGSAVFGVRHPL